MHCHTCVLTCHKLGMSHQVFHAPQAIHHVAGQFAAYVNVVTEAFALETVCKCRATRDYTQKGIPSAGRGNSC